MVGKFAPPVSCEIDPSNHCQNDCSFCVCRAYRKANPIDLDFGVYLDLLTDLRRMDVRSITFTGGGEPTMHLRFGDMVRAADGFEIGLITNGVDLDGYVDLVDRFRFIRVSLDAATDGTYRKIKGVPGFNRVVENIQSLVLRKGRTTIGIGYVVAEGNEHEISMAQKLMKDLGADYIEIRPDTLIRGKRFLAKGDGRSFIMKRYHRSSDRLPCAIAGLVGIVCANGDVCFCCQGRGRGDFWIGNLRAEQFSDIWRRRMERPPGCEMDACRYMNYAKGYELYSQERHAILRHHNFL